MAAKAQSGRVSSLSDLLGEDDDHAAAMDLTGRHSVASNTNADMSMDMTKAMGGILYSNVAGAKGGAAGAFAGNDTADMQMTTALGGIISSAAGMNLLETSLFPWLLF